MKECNRLVSLFAVLSVLVACQSLDPMAGSTEHRHQEDMVISTFLGGEPVQDLSPNGAANSSALGMASLNPESQMARPVDRVGVILAPAGAWAGSYIGFLNSLKSARVPMVGLLGMEWGSLAGLMWLNETGAHSGEWKFINLPYEQLKSGWLFSGKSTVEDWLSHFKGVNWGRSVKSLPMVYGCSFHSSLSESSFYQKNSRRSSTSQHSMKTSQNRDGGQASASGRVRAVRGRRGAIKSSGSLKEALQTCLPTKEFFQTEEFMGGPVSLKVAIDFLVKVGAQKILYLQPVPAGKSEGYTQSKDLVVNEWQSLKADVFAKSDLNFQWVPIEVNEGGPNDFSHLREYIDRGRQAFMMFQKNKTRNK